MGGRPHFPPQNGGRPHFSDGRRVRKTRGPDQTFFLYDASGSLAAEYTLGTPPASPCTTCYLTADHLGSTRLITDPAATPISRLDYAPFGEELLVPTGSPRFGIAGYGADAKVTEKFTGKERDTETGLDYFRFRTFSAFQGRFIQIDPGNAGARQSDPQSWNMYSYGLNSPLVFIDRLGLAASGYEICVLKDCWVTRNQQQYNAKLKQLGSSYRNVHGSLYYGNIKVGTTQAFNLDARLQGQRAAEGLQDATITLAGNYALALPGAKLGEFVGQLMGALVGRLAGRVASEGTQQGMKVALGLEQGLVEFAEANGAQHYGAWGGSNWRAAFLDLMGQDSTRALFNLDGVDVWPGVTRAAAGKGGATDWELLQIRNNPGWWDRITFYKGGQKVANPFAK